jgi:hypothetical protein
MLNDESNSLKISDLTPKRCVVSFMSPTANDASVFRPWVNALTAGVKRNLAFAVGEI